ncbi:unnamed protein product, partial [marine sediment metagenome]
EIFYLDLPSAERLPRTFGLLRVQPVPPAQVKAYLINRLEPEQGMADWNAIRTHRLLRIFRTPLILDKFTEKRKSGQSVPRSKIELLRDYFNDFFSTWELRKGRRIPDIEIKKEILSRLAGFLFEHGAYAVDLSDFQRQLRTIWNDLLRRHPSLQGALEPLKFLKQHGLIAQRGREEGFVLPIYRDFFLIEGGISTARTWQQQWRLAEICRELGFDTEAQDLYRAAAVDSQASGSCRIAAALYCNTQGDYATATELFQLEQKLDRDNPVAYQAYA